MVCYFHRYRREHGRKLGGSRAVTPKPGSGPGTAAVAAAAGVGAAGGGAGVGALLLASPPASLDAYDDAENYKEQLRETQVKYL